MLSKRLLHTLFVGIAVVMLAIGKFYDERLLIGNFNISIFFSLIYTVLLVSIFSTIKFFKITPIKMVQFSFLSLAIVFNLLLWIVYDFQQYGLTKFMNFIFITVPLMIVFSEKMEKKDLSFFIMVLFSVSSLLLLLFILNFSSLSSDRGGVLGGGPIVLSRWLCMGALISFFFAPLKKYRLILFPLFILIALFTGSRGPLLALFFTLSIYFLLNFRKLFYKTMAILSLLIVIGVMTGLVEYFQQFSTVARVFMNFTIDSSTSTSGRFSLINLAFRDIIDNPLGIGIGNWLSNSLDTNYLLIKGFNYPHNIFLEIFLEMGVIVGVLFLIYTILVLSRAMRLLRFSRQNSIVKLFFYVLIFLLFNAQVSGDLSDSRLLFIIMAVLTSYTPILSNKNHT